MEGQVRGILLLGVALGAPRRTVLMDREEEVRRVFARRGTASRMVLDGK